MVVKGNLLIDQYGNLLKVTAVKWDRESNNVHYRVKHIIEIVNTFGFRTSDDIKEGRLRKATKEEVKTRLILYGKKF